jgi:hypothetical protein
VSGVAPAPLRNSPTPSLETPGFAVLHCSPLCSRSAMRLCSCSWASARRTCTGTVCSIPPRSSKTSRRRQRARVARRLAPIDLPPRDSARVRCPATPLQQSRGWFSSRLTPTSGPPRTRLDPCAGYRRVEHRSWLKSQGRIGVADSKDAKPASAARQPSSYADVADEVAILAGWNRRHDPVGRTRA